jgi:hypothetical protein
MSEISESLLAGLRTLPDPEAKPTDPDSNSLPVGPAPLTSNSEALAGNSAACAGSFGLGLAQMVSLAPLASAPDVVRASLIPAPARLLAPAGAVVPAEVYTPESFLSLVLAHPELSQKELAEFYGQPIQWVSSIVASDAYQAALTLAPVKPANPFYSATLEERFKGLTLHALTVLSGRLSLPEVADATVLKAAELGIKALGLGLIASSEKKVDEAPNADRVAERLLKILERGRAPRPPETFSSPVINIPDSSQ